jgi:hypothetical protein
VKADYLNIRDNPDILPRIVSSRVPGYFFYSNTFLMKAIKNESVDDTNTKNESRVAHEARAGTHSNRKVHFASTNTKNERGDGT